jgi:hypothetical protein
MAALSHQLASATPHRRQRVFQTDSVAADHNPSKLARNRCIFRSCLLTGWCEFSTRLLALSPRSCSAVRPSLRNADRYDRSLSAMIRLGVKPCRSSSFFISLIAALASRRDWTRKSRISLSLSTARRCQICRPRMTATISSKYQWLLGRGRRRRKLAAMLGPNFTNHLRMVS